MITPSLHQVGKFATLVFIYLALGRNSPGRGGRCVRVLNRVNTPARITRLQLAITDDEGIAYCR